MFLVEIRNLFPHEICQSNKILHIAPSMSAGRRNLHRNVFQRCWSLVQSVFRSSGIYQHVEAVRGFLVTVEAQTTKFIAA